MIFFEDGDGLELAADKPISAWRYATTHMTLLVVAAVLLMAGALTLLIFAQPLLLAVAEIADSLLRHADG
ncbi:hypothetical protein GCM10010172_77050 [Paractinoplanes ferrugineus]|uniref:Uncharacterized protein n=1 Tax=Paractinoplanes ferrugineus TaxID=113564 RepID=A0A919J339_9ACTN|nr:hypothetical protein [Actinoplanes ferrugineus]GIE12779.1 hypothetical protein Afe05nite_46190 [Actinoplanes ferrugineus]